MGAGEGTIFCGCGNRRKKDREIRKKVLTKGFWFGIVAKHSARGAALLPAAKNNLRNGEKMLDKPLRVW